MFSVNLTFANNNVQNLPEIESFLESIKEYANDYFPELADEEYLNELIKGNVGEDKENVLEKIVYVFIGEFRDNIGLILKIIGIAILCSVLKNIQSSFGESNIGEIAFYICYLMIVSLIISSFTNVISICTETISKLSNFMNMIVPLIFALIASTGNITTISLLQPVVLGMIAFLAILLNKLIMPIIYIATVISVVTSISTHIKLDKLSEMLKKSSLWVMEISLIIFAFILSLEGTLAASVDGVTSKLAKNLVSNAIPVVGKVLGDTVDSVIGSVVITKNAIGIIGIMAILAITVSPLIKSLITMAVFNIATAFIEPLADSRISKCMNGVSGSFKIVVGILTVIIFIFIIAITMTLKISNNVLMYK